MTAHREKNSFPREIFRSQAYFLTDWDPIRDVYFYPPTDGPYAVYTLTELFDSIDTVIQRYANVTEEPIGKNTTSVQFLPSLSWRRM